jgi:hypothetical protein
MMSQPC